MGEVVAGPAGAVGDVGEAGHAERADGVAAHDGQGRGHGAGPDSAPVLAEGPRRGRSGRGPLTGRDAGRRGAVQDRFSFSRPLNVFVVDACDHDWYYSKMLAICLAYTRLHT